MKGKITKINSGNLLTFVTEEVFTKYSKLSFVIKYEGTLSKVSQNLLEKIKARLSGNEIYHYETVLQLTCTLHELVDNTDLNLSEFLDKFVPAYNNKDSDALSELGIVNP